jgi:hypothetical protein
MSTDHVIEILEIANGNLPALEDKYKKLQQIVNDLESKELDLSITLEELKDQVRGTNQALDACRLCYQKEVSKIFYLHIQNMGLERQLIRFKNNNSEYTRICFVAKQTVKSALSNKRRLLKLALNALIESWCADPTKFSSLIMARHQLQRFQNQP